MPAAPTELPAPPRHVTVIEPPTGWTGLNLRELWQYRDLLLLLVWRDISANYRQSIIGFGWALFKPIFSMVVFTLVFKEVANIDYQNTVPYPLFVLAGLLPWMYFSTSLAGSSQSVVGGSGLLTKVYFPRLILPLTSVLSGLLDFAIQFVLLFVVWAVLFVRNPNVPQPGWGLLLTPVFLVLCAAAALSVSLWLSALNARFRDIGHLVPYLLQMWMWLTPIVYQSSKLAGSRWRVVFWLNPMTGIIEGFRWSLFGEPQPDWGLMAVSFGVVLMLFVGGLFYFRRVERTFADVI